MTLDTEVGSETVMGVFGGDQALEMGIWLINRHAFVLLLLPCAATNFLLNSPRQHRSRHRTLPLMICVGAFA